jgi:hypothetical protein
MRPLLTLALACLLVTAGCSGLAPATDPAGSPTETLTPAPYTPPPPGLDASGEVSASDLAAAHVEALANRSFTVVEVRALTYPNGTTVRKHVITERTRLGADRRRYRFAFASTTAFVEHENNSLEAVYVSNGTLLVEKQDRNGDGQPDHSVVTEQNGTPTDPLTEYHGSPLNREQLLRLYEMGEFSLTRTDDGFRLRSSEPQRVDGGPTGLLPANATVTSITVSLTPEGRVRSYRMAFEGVHAGERVTGVERVTYSAVGNTTVSEPPWFEKVVNASG